LILDVISDTTDDPQVSQTLKRASVLSTPVGVKHVKRGYNVSELPPRGGKDINFSAIKAAAKGVGFLRILFSFIIF